jgi:hypothetical protein
MSDTAIRNLEPRQNPYKKSDGEGLYLSVYAGGFQTLAAGVPQGVDPSEKRKAFDGVGIWGLCCASVKRGAAAQIAR